MLCYSPQIQFCVCMHVSNNHMYKPTNDPCGFFSSFLSDLSLQIYIRVWGWFKHNELYERERQMTRQWLPEIRESNSKAILVSIARYRRDTREEIIGWK